MNLPLDGYRAIRVLRASGTTRVYAAIREHDQRAVVVKTYELADDETREARVEHEFRLIHNLEVEGVVQALALERAGTQLALVLDWCEGVNLEEFAGGRPVGLEPFLKIATQLARTLAGIHAQGVVHRDIKPTNLLIDPSSGVVSIADFGISVLLESERERINDPAVVEGTLPYLSPEQTGRTHREVDFRSDLYSLGVTFYELLTGQRPFASGTPLELIHAHLARRPQPPQWLRPDIPTPLSAMVMKLLEKAPEHRYQSARGLRLDLERFAAALASGRTIDEFELGLDDVPMTLQLPHRLYGRALDTELLLREFRQASTGQPRFVLVSGAAGIGKSALIGQLAEPVIGRHGYLARGKFDRELADKPYAGFVAAFSDLAEQLLTETDEQLGHWRRELMQVVGPVAGVLCELVPKLRAILGPTPSVADVGAVEAHNQLALACARLVAVFARAEHPLVVALDDLHWADRSSCELLAAMLAEPHAALLVVATMRVDELADGHPIRAVIDRIERYGDQMLWLELGPLGREHVAAMVADSLARPVAEVRSLAALVARKTNHNPLFIRQFLAYLVELGLLRATADGWIWDEAGIEGAGIPDDLLEMMTEKLDRLDAGPRVVLTTAAVVGTRFDLATVELLVGATRLATSLRRLVDEGLLTAVGPSRYAFTHDRIRDAAYATTTIAQRVALHRKISEFRLERVGLTDLSESIFELVDHLDFGIGLIPVPGEDPAAAALRATAAVAELRESERANLAELNALAGYKSLNGAAAEPAVRYLRAGIELLSSSAEFPRPHQPGHTLRVALELGLCQALGLAGQMDQSQRRYDALLRRPVEPSDYGHIVAKRISSLIVGGQRRAAVDAGLAGLRELGYGIDLDRGKVELGAALLRLAPNLRPAELRRLGARGRVKDERVKAAMEVLASLSTVTYFVDTSVHLALLATHVRLIVEHGRHSSAPMALTQTGLLFGAFLGQREVGLELVDVALALAEREGPACMRHRIEPARWVLASWRQPYVDAIEPLREAAASALEAGDLEYAGYATVMLPSLSLASGVHLRALEQVADLAGHRLQQWGATTLLPGMNCYRRFAQLLGSGDLAALTLADPLEIEAMSDEPERRASKGAAAQLQGLLCLLFGHHRAGWELLQRFADLRRLGLAGAWYLEIRLVTEGLLAAALHGQVGVIERVRMLRVLERNHRQLQRGSKLGQAGPRGGGASLAAAAALLAAELAAIRGPITAALVGFGKARRMASACGSTMLEALALERMAEHASAHELDDLALGPASEARARYHHWGALTKVAQLEQRWPRLASDRSDPARAGSSGSTTGTSSSTTGGALDMATILKTSQAIAEDLRLEEVVARVMAIALENAGAARAVMVLRRDGKPGVVAICSTEHAVQTYLRKPIPLERAGDEVPISVVHFVERTLEPAVLDDVSVDLRFSADPYVERHRVRSVLCLPILKQNRLLGALYLENKLSAGSFTSDRLEILRLLVTQAASALDNAQLYEALRTSEVRWRSLVEGLPDIILLLDRHGRIEFINHIADDSDRARLIGALAGDFIDEDHLPTVRATMTEVLRTGEQRDLELRASFTGAPCWYMSRFAPIVVDGRVERVIAVGTDVTERRAHEASQARLEATIRQQQRLESIGTLASGVAHEINNPVQGIMNYAELIATSPESSDQAREFAAEIGHESQRVATIVRNLLAFSRQEGDRAAGPARVAEIVDGTLSLIRTVLRKDQIALQLDIPEDLPEVRCRVQQIQQVIMNLITNARDSVRTRWPDYHDDKRIEIRAAGFERGGQPWIRISVYDRGGGVPEAVVPRIFDPFFTTKGRDQGTGLGLAVSHGIVMEHGGELWLENVPGESACFHIELPTGTSDG